MDILIRCCAGLDVHKDTVVVCVRRLPSGRKRKVVSEVRTFGTTTSALLEMSDWLASAKVTHVAMESTGVYWRRKGVRLRFPDQFPR
jgi:transposase